MDPLHPLVPIEPAAPPPPNYTRVQRIERDQQRESSPDWQQSSEDGSDEEAKEQFEDDYDPDWAQHTAEAGYGPDGIVHDAPVVPAPEKPSEQPSDRHGHDERRSEAGSPDDGDDPPPGLHIDITA